MKKNKYLRILTTAVTAALLSAGSVRADSFDDAVTQYLKGFEFCKEAKSHLSANRIGAAQQAMAQYNQLLEQATRTDRSILATSKRGMDGNLKFCTRVARDVEVEAGMPVMNKALAACDAAQQALKDDRPDLARTELTNFRSLKDQALTLAPSLGDIFTVKNQISRCERIDSKIASSSQKQEALKLALETAQEESMAYVASCQKTLEALNREKMLDDPVLRDANQGLNSALSHKKNALDEKLANQAFRENVNHPVKLALNANLKKGDQCVATLNQNISRKNQELDAIKSQFSLQRQQLNAATDRCQTARRNVAGSATQERYDTTRQDYENALNQRNDILEALTRNTDYRRYDSWDMVRGIEQQMQMLNSCLDDTSHQMKAMFAALSVTPVAPAAAAVAATPAASTASASVASTAAAAPAPASATPSTAAPARFSGTLRMNGLTPEFVLFYVADDTTPANVDITIDRTGFDSLLYVVRDGASLTLKNKDNTTHRITASNERLKLLETLARLQPRQSKQAQVTWPVNSIATLRSDRGALPASYIANVPSANYLRIKFRSGTDSQFSFQNDKGISTAWLIMPDADPLSFTLTRGETKSLAITREHVPVGSLLVTGE